MKKNLKKGFTLIELLVVIAIIGILSSVVLVSLNTARQKARDASRKSNMQALTTAISLATDAFNNNVSASEACTGISGWTAAVTPMGCPNFLVPTYVPKLPTDTSANVYTYVTATVPDKTFCLGARLEGPIAPEASFMCGSSGCSATTAGPATFATAWVAANCPTS